MDGVTAEVLGFVPWGPPDGASESLEPVWPTSPSADVWPPAAKHAESRLRVLPDGSPQLTLGNSAGARVVRLGAEPVQVAVRSAADVVRDAVMTADGTVVVIEQVNHPRRYDVRGVAPDGTTAWHHSYPGEDAGVTYNSRLLTDGHGRVFVTTRGSLIQFDNAESTVVARWPGQGAVLCPDGRTAYVRTGPGRTEHVVVRDLATSEEKKIELGPEITRDVLHDVIGVDAAGRIYWRGYGTLSRMEPGGDLDWRVGSVGIAVSESHGATILTFAENGRVARFDNGGRLSVDLFADDREGRLGGGLAGRGDDGGYVLYRAVEGSYGELSYLDRHGRLLRTEPAPDDVWLTMDRSQRPDYSSVAPDGTILVAVHSKLGAHVVRLTPDRAVEGVD